MGFPLFCIIQRFDYVALKRNAVGVGGRLLQLSIETETIPNFV